MKRIDIIYGGEHYSVGGRDLESLRAEIEEQLASGGVGWITVNDGEGALMRRAGLMRRRRGVGFTARDRLMDRHCDDGLRGRSSIAIEAERRRMAGPDIHWLASYSIRYRTPDRIAARCYRLFRKYRTQISFGFVLSRRARSP